LSGATASNALAYRWLIELNRGPTFDVDGHEAKAIARRARTQRIFKMSRPYTTVGASLASRRCRSRPLHALWLGGIRRLVYLIPPIESCSPVMYSLRASTVQKAPVVNAVKAQANSDAKAVASALKTPGKSSLEHGIGAIQQISSIVSTVPSVLTGCSLLLALIQYIFIEQRWRKRSINEFRADLAVASDAMKKWLGA
jgi:hypothetical protein